MPRRHHAARARRPSFRPASGPDGLWIHRRPVRERDAYQGQDYETEITVRAPTAAGVTLGSTALVKDRAGDRNRLSVVRTVSAQDLSGARALVLGFDTDDAEVLPGTTAIGPSGLVLGELERTGRAAITVRRHASHPEAAGTLEPVGKGNASAAARVAWKAGLRQRQLLRNRMKPSSRTLHLRVMPQVIGCSGPHSGAAS